MVIVGGDVLDAPNCLNKTALTNVGAVLLQQYSLNFSSAAFSMRLT